MSEQLSISKEVVSIINALMWGGQPAAIDPMDFAVFVVVPLHPITTGSIEEH